MKKIMKIFQSLEVCCLLINNFTEIIEMRTLGLLGIMLTGKDVIRTDVGVIRAVDGVISAELDFYRLTLWLILRCKDTAKTSLSLKVFISELIY